MFVAEVMSTCSGMHNLHYCQEMLEGMALWSIVLMVCLHCKSRSTFICFEIRTASSVWKHSQMGFGLECPLVQLALTMDMKGIHEVVSHCHLQKAFWTTVTACTPKRLCTQGLRKSSVWGLVWEEVIVINHNLKVSLSIWKRWIGAFLRF